MTISKRSGKKRRRIRKTKRNIRKFFKEENRLRQRESSGELRTNKNLLLKCMKKRNKEKKTLNQNHNSLLLEPSVIRSQKLRKIKALNKPTKEK